MAQRKSEDETTLEQVLRLASKLTPEEQAQLVDDLKRQWLRRELQQGEDELRRGESFSGEEVIAELRDRNKAFGDKKST